MVRKIGTIVPVIIFCTGQPMAAELTDSIETQVLEEVTVTGNSARQRISNNRLGAEKLELSKLTMLPSFGVESDIIK